MPTVRVELAERSYDIKIGSGNLSEAGSLIGRLGRFSRALVITDSNVQETHAVAVAEGLVTAGMEVDLIAIEPGEQSKSIETAAGLWEGLVELGADRKSVVVAVGGGVVGDLAGFIAATYARGIRFVQVPTTLLAQVDSSVGGKVGINLTTAKNMVGAFLQPLAVLIDTETLSTLPEREYVAGLGEVVKYGVILDAELFEYLESRIKPLIARDPDVLEHVIARSCELKADIVRQDEREETGLRAVLNYGHTFAHALETLTHYKRYLHGEAVAIGMQCAARLAERLGRVEPGLAERQGRLMAALGLPVALPKLDHEKFLESMMHDKKVEHGRLRLVLPTRLGHVELVSDVPGDDVLAALEDSGG
jgi:3-dehydroquinate synthase